MASASRSIATVAGVPGAALVSVSVTPSITSVQVFDALRTKRPFTVASASCAATVWARFWPASSAGSCSSRAASAASPLTLTLRLPAAPAAVDVSTRR
ncbi:MAG: hypothetical protein M5U08_04555 [Burkholderiales bacterium]|nr:hypothetical protein [Burkholderiales bacterium]